MATSSGDVSVTKTVLLLSGTHEGPLLAEALLEAGFQVRATVTRAEAIDHLFGRLKDRIGVEARGFTEESLGAFLDAGHADIVLDATHPFAVRITLIARAACARAGTPYIRFERPDWMPPAGTFFADSFAEAARLVPELGARIMLTIGAKQLKHFVSLQDRLVLFARILPSPVSIQQAIAAGFRQDRLLCMRPPFSKEFNKALFHEYRADGLLTKASGLEGGVREKVLAAVELGMKVLMIRRPALNSRQAVSTVADAVQACVRASRGQEGRFADAADDL
jgi:precorrin-6A/cobalt-precorrin-6A reductase